MKKKLSLLMVAFMAVAAFAVQNSWRADGDEWTIAGSESVLGSNWDVTDTNNNMTLGEDGITYTLVKENVTLGNGKYAYKVVKNHDWANENYGANGQLGGADCELVIAEDGVYNVTFTFVNDDSHALSATAVKTGSAVVEKTYTVAGSSATLFGTAWDPTNTANDMTLADGVYTWSKSDVELAAGDVEFKVVVNHSWAVSYGQNGGSSNYVLKIEEAGIYTVAITFDAETNVPAAVATKTGDVVEPTYVYAVVGGKKVADGEEADAAIFSGNWDAAGTTDFMTLDEESGKYVWTKEAAKLDPQTIALKVIKKVEGAEDAAAWYPTNDVEIVIAEAGLYNVTVTFDPKAEDLWAQSTVVATAEPVVEPVVINSMAIVGDLTGGWPVKNEETGEWDWSMALQLVQDAENPAQWSATVEGVDIEARTYQYKAAANNSWDGYQLPETGNAEYTFTEAGKYNLTFTANVAEHSLALAAEKVEEPVVIEFPENAIVYDFEAAGKAGENPANVNGSTANGTAFYAWESESKTNSLRQDYKGYAYAEGSVLPEECRVWRRGDRINGNVIETGLKNPNDKELAINGVNVGDKVVFVFDATEATNKELLWVVATGEGSEEHTTAAKVNGETAVTGETTIASGAEIEIESTNCNYFVVKAMKGMVIKQIAVIPVEKPETFAIVGELTGGWDNDVDMTQSTEDENVYTLAVEGFEAEAKAYQYKLRANKKWGVYELPAVGNAEYTFTEAGKYNLTFTANVAEHTLTLNAEKVEEPAAPENIFIKPESGDIAAALNAAKAAVEKVGDITIELTKGAEYTISESLVAPAGIKIYGNEATIDASALDAPFILMSTEPTVEEVSSYYRVNSVELRGVTVNGLKNSIFYDNNTKYCVVDFVIDYSVLNLATEAVQNEALISFQQGGAKDFTVTNSTIYGNNAVAKYFIRYNNSARLDRYGFDKDTEFQTMTYKNNTFYGLLMSGGQWGNYNGIAGQVYSKFDVQNNIWFNCGKDIIRRMAGGRFNGSNPMEFAFNAYFNDGANIHESEASYDKSETILKGELSFTDAANGDFNGEYVLAEGETAPESLGAPIWNINFKAAPVVAVDYYLVGDFNEWANNDDYKLTLNTEAVGVEEYMITDVELAEGAEFKVKSSTDVWYPDGEGNNYVVGEAGKYTIYFRPNADGGEGWHYNVIYAENLTVGINLVKADDLKNAEIFNLNGQRVQNAQKGLYIVNGRKVVIK